MGSITKVALAGATGNLGPAILNALLDAEFQVTVLTRQGSSHTFPISVAVKAVDYDSVDSLTAALQGQDALVSTLGALALPKQVNLIQAAVQAKVKRFLPSEFGSNTSNPKAAQLPVFAGKVVVQDALKKEAEAGKLTYTLVSNGPFFDWGMRIGLVLNAKEKSVDLYDGGDKVYSATTLATVGKAVAGVLKHPEETKNRAVFVQDVAVTQKKLLTLAEKVTGEKWAANHVSTENDVLGPAWAELKKENPDPSKFAVGFIKASIFGEGYGSHFEKTDNALLGIREMGDGEIEAIIRDVVTH
ncbi:NAD(P)-binding protein [Xylariaceae sp. FL0016]|nr:NAD(P)-binding protein [Xylariaceae sp. FL0016]